MSLFLALCNHMIFHYDENEAINYFLTDYSDETLLETCEAYENYFSGHDIKYQTLVCAILLIGIPLIGAAMVFLFQAGVLKFI